jgi:hypothetical protein
MIYIDLNLILLLWESIPITTRLLIAYFQQILTMAECKSDTQAPKRWKDGLESGTSQDNFWPSGYEK